MKTQEELNALKEEVETLNKKLHELTEEELAQVCGGFLVNNGQESLSDKQRQRVIIARAIAVNPTLQIED